MITSLQRKPKRTGQSLHLGDRGQHIHSINGTNVWTVNAGETYAHLECTSSLLRDQCPSSRPPHDGFWCEVGGAILPPITCTASDEVAFAFQQ